jgi:hypothetical protein
MLSEPPAETARKYRRLERWKDRATIASSVVAVGALLFTAWQFYKGRQALQAQAIIAATNSAAQLNTEMLRNAPLYSKIFNVGPEALSDDVAARQLIALYVAQYYEYQAGLLPDDAWEAIRGEICTIRKLPMITSRISVPDRYPKGFADVVSACK